MEILLLIKSVFYYVGFLGFTFLFLLAFYYLTVYIPAWFMLKKAMNQAKLRFILRNLQYFVLAIGAGHVSSGVIMGNSAGVSSTAGTVAFMSFCLYALYYRMRRISNWAITNFEYREEAENLNLTKFDKYSFYSAFLLFVLISLGTEWNIYLLEFSPVGLIPNIVYFKGYFGYTLCSLIGWVFMYGVFEKIWETFDGIFARKGATA